MSLDMQSISGTEEERALFHEVYRHYQTSEHDLRIRMKDWDKKDILFRNYIDENSWPYKALVTDPRVFTALYEKAARTFAQKPRGRMIPREGSDVIKAHICNELLNFQWDDNTRADNESMLQKWIMMDLNARKYGGSFALVKWKYQKKAVSGKDDKGKSIVWFDGPDFKPLNPRDCLPNPAYSTIKNWFQYRDYVTWTDLKNTNDAARSKPIYKNLDLLEQQLMNAQQKDLSSERGGDTRAVNYTNKDLAIKGLTDTLGTDAVFKTLEIVTEYRDNRWITFAPKHGTVLRDIPNPYDHHEIPVVQLKYYPIDTDIYGLSEIEPVERLQKAINGLVSQYLDAINMSLYAPLKINSTGGAVQMHTLEFGPGKKWLMQNPQTDVIPLIINPTGVQEFTSTYRFLVSAMQEALGETSASVSNLLPGSGEKTATEVRDLASTRTARDNFNQMLLGETMKRQMTFWHVMDKQFMFDNQEEQQKIIQIIGKDAMKFFQQSGLDGMSLSQDSQDALANPDLAGSGVTAQDLETPTYPVKTKKGDVTKFKMNTDGQSGHIYLEKGDLDGDYEYIPDVSSMGANASDSELNSKTQALTMITSNPIVGQQLQQEGYSVKIKELLVDHFEDLGFKNADQYFEKLPPPQGAPNAGQPGQQTQPPGTGTPQQGQPGLGDGGVSGVQPGPQALPA